jgi:hypothetical protein
MLLGATEMLLKQHIMNFVSMRLFAVTRPRGVTRPFLLHNSLQWNQNRVWSYVSCDTMSRNFIEGHSFGYSIEGSRHCDRLVRSANSSAEWHFRKPVDHCHLSSESPSLEKRKATASVPSTHRHRALRGPSISSASG